MINCAAILRLIIDMPNRKNSEIAKIFIATFNLCLILFVWLQFVSGQLRFKKYIVSKSLS